MQLSGIPPRRKSTRPACTHSRRWMAKGVALPTSEGSAGSQHLRKMLIVRRSSRTRLLRTRNIPCRPPAAWPKSARCLRLRRRLLPDTSIETAADPDAMCAKMAIGMVRASVSCGSARRRSASEKARTSPRSEDRPLTSSSRGSGQAFSSTSRRSMAREASTTALAEGARKRCAAYLDEPYLAAEVGQKSFNRTSSKTATNARSARSSGKLAPANRAEPC